MSPSRVGTIMKSTTGKEGSQDMRNAGMVSRLIPMIKTREGEERERERESSTCPSVKSSLSVDGATRCGSLGMNRKGRNGWNRGGQ